MDVGEIINELCSRLVLRRNAALELWLRYQYRVNGIVPGEHELVNQVLPFPGPGFFPGEIFFLVPRREVPALGDYVSIDQFALRYPSLRCEPVRIF
jgi:hypothetical protein